MKLSVVIPSLNGGAILAEHLPEVCRQAAAIEGGAEVLVVDDASDARADNSREVVLAQPGARWLALETRRGFAGSSNHGAAESHGELLLLLNNDMHPEPGALEALLREFARCDGLFALSPVIVNVEEGFPESTNRAYFRRGVFELTFPGRQGIPAPARGERRPLAYACGGAMLCRRELFLDLGGFPELHAPFYWEDADLGWRAQRRGLEIFETGNARVRHDHSRTIGAFYNRKQVRRIYERNRLLFTWVHLVGVRATIEHLLWLFPRWLWAVLRGHPAAAALPKALVRLAEVRRARQSLSATMARAHVLLNTAREGMPRGDQPARFRKS